MNNFCLVGRFVDLKEYEKYLEMKIEFENYKKEKKIIKCRLSKGLSQIKEYSYSVVGIKGNLDLEDDDIILIATKVSFLSKE